MTVRALCRDCCTRCDAHNRRCPACHSPRLLMHEEMDLLSIAHIDCDAFYAAVEKRDNPDLLNRPVIIGGGRRGVVSTACYIARTYGVRSAMPMFKAREACPDAVVIPPNMDKYAAVGAQVREAMRVLSPLVEPLSIDEAFLDLSGTDRLHRAPPVEVLTHFAKQIEQDIGISVSVGLSHNKFLAKIASDLQKPRGFAIIGKAETKQFLAGQPVSLIWGVGKAMQATLKSHGIETIGQLQTMEESDLYSRFGSMGGHLFRLSRGRDSRAVETSQGAKSISNETTFTHDMSDRRQLEIILHRMAEKVSERLKKSDLSGRTVTVKLKTGDFKLRTRSKQLHSPTQLANRIYGMGVKLLRPELDGTSYRLLGIGVSDLQSAELADPVDLVEQDDGKAAAAERAMDELKSKFGAKSVALGHVWQPPDREAD